jgi:hypothetical protein
MEIYYEEISRGKVNFEVSVHDTNDRNMLAMTPDSLTPPFFVFLTARDEASRTIWSTPVMSEQGKMKSYESVDEAITDGIRKLRF